ncbi:MAG: HupE/UreJ family protein, partial [Spongiibacteraceae bacterium]|nr:HupE/UreJ family protein [Spongiibacteraceae bacterium]
MHRSMKIASSSSDSQPRRCWSPTWMQLAALLLAAVALPAAAHGVEESDAAFIQALQGVHLVPWLYLGAKHMFTGYDHLLFLAGVIFFLYRLRDVALYVTLFAIGHSLTLLLGVLGGIHANPWLIDTLIGFSVVYKAFDNIGGLERLRLRIDTRAAVFVFGLAHGFGLSTKLQDLSLARDGLFPNMVAFNVGVELGQLAALALMVLLFQYWRRTASFERVAFTG